MNTSINNYPSAREKYMQPESKNKKATCCMLLNPGVDIAMKSVCKAMVFNLLTGAIGANRKRPNMENESPRFPTLKNLRKSPVVVKQEQPATLKLKIESPCQKFDQKQNINLPKQQKAVPSQRINKSRKKAKTGYQL